jgi:hypothetical protein
MRNFLSELRDVFSSNSMARNPILGKMDPRDMAQGLSATQPMSPAMSNALMGFVPGVGDAIGLGQDMANYATDPGSRNWLNYGLSAAALIPGVPRVARAKVEPGSAEWFDQMRPPPPTLDEQISSYFNGVNVPKMSKPGPVSTPIFHGSQSRVTELSPELSTNALTRMLGRPTYFGTPSLDLAKSYGPQVSRLQANIKNPLVIDMNGRDWQEAHSFVTEFGRDSGLLDGHDGIIFKNVMDSGAYGLGHTGGGPIAHDVYALFDPPKKAPRR